MGRYTVRIAKPQHKFAAAHFTIFPDGQAELLHGHNYRVLVEIEGEADERGFLVPFHPLKELLRAACDALDERVILPAHAQELHVARRDGQVIAELGAREYRFPEADVVLLPIANVTVEALAAHLAPQLAAGLLRLVDRARLDVLRVGVEESDGQSACFAVTIARLP
ncbi:MAG: 6-carboxytetrahydropterin synthase [Planctomycetota bacterium]